ncbi:MAG: fibronectin type III domain-containing protein [Chitinophagales bacterium]|nr:fibronectin type III domain-containing protein [Chitinophagales bacterium]
MKKLFLSFIIIAIAFPSFALTSIYTKKVLGGPFCAGTTISVAFLTDTPAEAGNVFTAELSDKDGNFGSPLPIGSIVKTTSGLITCELPIGLESGSKYRVRVVANNPAVIGTSSENKISINAKPKELSVTNIKACEATLNWASLASAAAYKVQYRIAGSGSWSSTFDAGTATSYTFTGLNASTNYDFQVRAICANDQKSDWSKASAATTACPTPASLIVTAVGLTTSSLDWADAACTTGYLFQYRAFGEPTWIQLTSPTSNINLTGLFAATLYEAQVANDCGTTNSAWSVSSIWETEYFRLAGDAAAVSSFSVYPNPASGAFTVSFDSGKENAEVEILVQNMFGQLVYKTKNIANAGINQQMIDLNNATAGVYFVTIKADGKELKTSLMVN